MSLTTIFQLSVLTLTGLSGAMLAFGEGAPFPSAITVILCSVAYLCTERRHLVRIGALASNLLGIVALGLAVFEFFGQNLESRLLAGAHFLVYLTWIVLFQDKRFRQYWWLLALGMLQVAVGSVLTDSGWYGVFLLVYLLLAVWTMAVFNLYQGAAVFGALGPLRPEAGRLSDSPLFAARGRAPARENVPAETTLASLFRPQRRSHVRAAIQQDSPGKWVSFRFVLGVTGIAFGGLAVGLAMFLLVPRISRNSGTRFIRRVDAAVSAASGFANEVRLGHLGRILESNDRVMQVQLFDGDSGRPLRLEEFVSLYGLEEPLFRGSVLHTYRSGKWSGRELLYRGRYLEPPRRTKGIIRQDYRLDYADSGLLFAMRPVQRAELSPLERIVIDPETGVMAIQTELRENVKYSVFSPRPGAEAEFAVTAARPFADMPALPAELGGAVDPWYSELPEAGLERLIDKARQIVNSDRGGPTPGLSPAARRARQIVSWLRDSGEFSYSLNMTVIDPSIDPVEDFLFNRRSGHCEYYASALALMLRAVDIPSRVVTGFKGAERISSSGGSYYEIMQRHAHAWVEAVIDGDWAVLDATPAARDESVRSHASGAGMWNTTRSQLVALWSNYVISMSSSRQKETFYDPILGSVSAGFKSLRTGVSRVAASFLRFNHDWDSPNGVFSGPAIVALLLLIALAFVVAHLLRGGMFHLRSRRPASHRAGWRRWLPKWLHRILGSTTGAGFVVEFYQRFVHLLSLHGLQQSIAETPREFAQHVERALREPLRGVDLVTLPSELTELYYRVRFGGQALAPSEAETLEPRLRLLEERLRRRP